MIRASVSNPAQNNNCVVCFEPDDSALYESGVLLARSLNKVSNGTIIVELSNLLSTEYVISRKTVLGRLVELDEGVNMLSPCDNQPDLDVANASSLFDMSGTDLSEVQLCKVRALLDRYGHSVSRSDLDLGLTGTVQHKIDVQGSEPVKQRYHRVLGPLKHEVEEQLGELERKGIIEQSDSPWSSPLVPVRKKNGQVRICLDYRLLNDRSRLDSFPLPNMVDMLSALSGATYFSTLDLSKGFYQIELEPESRPYTAFSTGGSHYQFRVMPFGLSNAPATAQRLISFVLAGLSWDVAMAYIDDILVTGANFDEHLKNLETVLSRLVHHGLKVKPQKCSLFRRKVEYLGHLVSSAGIEPSPAGIEAIMKFPMPRTVRQVRSFLVTVNFSRRHEPKCSK